MTTLTSQMIQKETRVDLALSLVYGFIIGRWPIVVDPTFAPFKSKRDELTTQQGCILWGTRAVVPSPLQAKFLQELRDTHPEMSRIKAFARSYVWWPNIDSHIERTVSSCNTCQSMRSAPPTAQTHPWIFPARPWSCIHVDFAGSISGCMYMAVVDAFSKFPEVGKMTNTTAQTTSLHYVISSADMAFLKYLFLTMVLSLPQENLNNFVETMAYYIELQQPICHPPMARLSVLSKF